MSWRSAGVIKEGKGEAVVEVEVAEVEVVEVVEVEVEDGADGGGGGGLRRADGAETACAIDCGSPVLAVEDSEGCVGCVRGSVGGRACEW